MSASSGASAYVKRLVARRWWLVLLAVVAGLATAALLTARTPRAYRATVTLVVTPSPDLRDDADVMRALETLERRTVVATFARIPSARRMRDEVARRIELPADSLRAYRIRASVVPYTNAIEISVTGPDRERTARVAEAAGEHTKEEAAGMYRIFRLRDFEPAAASYRPVHPDPQRNLAVGVLVGLFVGIGVVFLVDWSRRTRIAEAAG